MPFDLFRFLAGCWFVVRFDFLASPERCPCDTAEDHAMLERATLRLIQRVTGG